MAVGQLQGLNLGKLPVEILESARAVLWKYEIRKGKRTKVPYVPSDPFRRASVTDPSTWGSFPEACDAFEDGKADGVGIVLGDGLVGVDLDRCRDPQTGVIEPHALTIIKPLGSYTEISPSGRGVHILMRGSLPAGRRRKGTVEMYERARYFTVTGAHLSMTPTTIEDRTAELAIIHAELFNSGTNADGPAASNHYAVPATLDDQRLIELARGARNGAAFSRLWDGGTSDYASPSEADLALCNHLAFYTGCDSAQMDRLYRQSDLMRQKWDERRGDSTYGAQTIDLTIADCSEVYRPGGTQGLTIRSVPSVAADSDGSDRGVSVDDFHAYMPQHLYVFAPSREPWPAVSVNARLPPVPLLDDAGNPVLDGNGQPKTIKPSLWLDQHRAVEQMTWAPGQPMLVPDRLISEGGWIERPDCTVFNLYRPPLITWGDATKADTWLEHVRRVYPDDAGHIIRWLAHRVQRPDEKINHALVLGGLQGIGKDTLLEPVKSAIGPWNFIEAFPTHLLGRFNGFVKSVILRLSEARDLGEIDRYSFYERLKVYTAAPPDVLRVDEKNLREYSALNVCGVVVTTNYKTNGIYLPADDRRHYVAWSDLTKEEFTRQYFTDLYRWYAQGGNEHVAAYLATLDLTGYVKVRDPAAKDGNWKLRGRRQVIYVLRELSVRNRIRAAEALVSADG